MSDEVLFEGEDQPHLLLVDDDPTFTRVMARAMSRRGLRVSTAGSAEEGLALAEQDVPDYAVVDLKMNGDSGLVLLPKLLELDAEMRVVILTGYSSIATAVEAIKRGACNYLCNPADADDVLAAGQIPTMLETGSFVVHPPLGKWIIGAGMWLFGPGNSFGWRFSVALLGTVAVLLIMLIALKLFKSTMWAALAGFFFAIDGVAIVLARTALLDTILMSGQVRLESFVLFY
jgi:ActR/RegA family two-component response regulator